MFKKMGICCSAWTDFKSLSNNSYSYITGTVSWTGYSTETTIIVSKCWIKEA